MANHRMVGHSTRGKLAAGTAAQLSPFESPANAELQPLARQAFAEQLLDRVPEAIVLVDQQSRILRQNPEFTRMFGYSPEEATGCVIDDLIVPEYKKGEGSRLGRDVQAGKTVEVETRRRRKSGELIDVSLLVTPVNTAEGQVGYYAIYRDISQRKHAEKLQAALYRIAQTASSTEDLNELYADIHRIVGELMYAKNFYVALFDRETQMVTVPYFVDQFDQRPEPWKLRRGLTDYVLRIGKPLLVTPERDAALRAMGEIEIIGTPTSDWMGVPLKKGDETFGVLAVQSYESSQRFTERECDILSFVSQQVANAIQSRRKHDELRESEAKFRAVAETAPSAIFIYREGKPLYVNIASSQMTGYTREELMQMQVFDIIHPADRVAAQRMAAARARGESVAPHQEFKFVTKQGEERCVDFRGTLIHYQGAAAILGIAFDVTDKRRAEDNLRVQSTLLEQLFEASPEPVLLLDMQHRVLKVNREFIRLFGFTGEEAVGRTVSELSILPEGKEEEAKQVIRTVEENRTLNIETVRRNKRGILIDVEILGTPIEIDGKPAGYYAIYRDITARKKAERALHELNLSLEQHVQERTAQLEDANRELEAFSYSVSHDLRAPLRHIDGFVKLLLRREHGKLDETSERYFHDIADSSRHMGALIDDLLAFSRTSRVELKEQTVELNELFETVMARLMRETDGRRKVRSEFGPMPAVRGDYSLLQIAVTNLLSNALKYSAGREESRVCAGVAGEDGNEIAIFVRDNGVGFDMQYAHKLFGVFQRLHRDDEFEGTGIGLATVRRIISRHGGRAWAEGKVDGGATFYFTLPKAG